MPADERVQAYNELHATGERTLITTTCGGHGGCSSNLEKTLYLANGMQVHHPEDLLPAVGPESHTARAVHEVHDARRKANRYMAISALSAVGFFLIGAASLSRDEPGFSTPAKLGLVGAVGGLMGAGIAAWFESRRAADAWGVANERYNASLAERLDVCTAGLHVVPCDAGAAPSSTTPFEVKPIER